MTLPFIFTFSFSSLLAPLIFYYKSVKENPTTTTKHEIIDMSAMATDSTYECHQGCVKNKEHQHVQHHREIEPRSQHKIITIKTNRHEQCINNITVWYGGCTKLERLEEGGEIKGNLVQYIYSFLQGTISV